MNDWNHMDQIFNPTSVAIAGASAGKRGEQFLESLIKCGFQGKIYPINPRGEPISGLEAYTDIESVPGPIDYVICCIPAPAVPGLIRDCAAKGVKAVAMFTAGYSESGTEEGRQREAEISRLARETGVRIIGPNCLGLYTPGVGLAFGYPLPAEGGRAAFMCQSGGNTGHVIRAAAQRGVRFSKAISFGNACDINESELIEYFAQDRETDVVAMYIEGVKDGPRFFRALRELARSKPVVVHKGGYTPSGAGAAASHTGSLAGSNRVWDELLRQTGAIRVYSLDELADMLVTFTNLRPPRGRRVGLFGGGGGATVVATDDWDRAGFALPPLPQVLKEEISGVVTNDTGLILSNPLDLSSFAYTEDFYRVIKRLSTYDGFVDLSVVHVGFAQMAWVSIATYGAMIDYLRDAFIRIHHEIDRPLALVAQYLVNSWDWRKALEDLQEPCSEVGIPVYYSMGTAARAIDRFMQYQEWRGNSEY
ncbi:CoA-binding protein [Chloroflexota bacterium]